MKFLATLSAFVALSAFAFRANADNAASCDLDLKPTFNCCGVEFKSTNRIDGLRLEWRVGGDDAWTAVDALEFPYFPKDGSYRGSIRGLPEDTDYSVRLATNGAAVAQGAFRTWKSDVPIAKTIEISTDVEQPIVISERGAADGWIRYVAKDGKTLDFGEGENPPIAIRGARYVVIDGLRILGNRARHVFDIRDARFVRIRNCDISRWGRTGEPRFDKKGWIFDPAKPEGKWGINLDGAIKIGQETFACVVERCWIHDPRGRANSWFYSHPSGPEAIVMDRPEGSTVIRWNDFVGSDLHRYNDAVEGTGNFNRSGGFNRDADVYGNFMAFCNDDCIELDGGQRNVRCQGNRFESSYCGVSVQGCMRGPSYVCDNLFSGMGGEFGESGQTLKTGGGEHGPDAVVVADRNTFWGKGSGVTMMNTLRVILRDNVFCGGQAIKNPERSPSSISKGNRFEVELPEEELDPAYPRRPVPFTLDRARISGIKIADGKAEPETVRVMVRGGAEPSDFTIAKNNDFDWFEVVPSKGTVPADGELELKVKFNAEKMRDRRHYRGAFLVRTETGLSRPVSLYAETDFVPPYRAEKEGDVAIYHPAFKEGEWTPLCDGDGCGEFAFDVPADGRYYFMVRSKGWLKLKVAVDDDAPAVSRQQNAGHPTWTMLAPGKVFGDMCRHYDLRKGRHVVKIWKEAGKPVAEGLVLTDNPLPFEPR